MTVFYKSQIAEDQNTLSEEESKHCALVLRHQVGDQILVQDGKGGIYNGVLTHVSKKSCQFKITTSSQAPTKSFSIHLAIAPTKNAERMEWMVEKLSELGVDRVTFITTEHSERKKLRMDRLEKKAISAMKQSGNPFLLKLDPPTDFEAFLIESSSVIKLIAHVDPMHVHISDKVRQDTSIVMLIGPEGDFSPNEVELAANAGYTPVSLGTLTLRTETAGLMACQAINLVNRY